MKGVYIYKFGQLLDIFLRNSTAHLVPWGFHDSYNVVITLKKLRVYGLNK